MKHIRNFRNFSINEMQDWAMMPVDVNRGLGDMIASQLDKFYGEFSSMMERIKDYLGRKFEEFKTYLTTISLGIKKIDKSQLKEMASNVKNYFGENTSNKEIANKVEHLVNDQIKKEDSETASKNVLQKIFGKVAMFLAPVVTPMVHKVTVVSDKVTSSLNTPIDTTSVNPAVVLCVIAIVVLAIIIIRAIGSSEN